MKANYCNFGLPPFFVWAGWAFFAIGGARGGHRSGDLSAYQDGGPVCQPQALGGVHMWLFVGTFIDFSLFILPRGRFVQLLILYTLFKNKASKRPLWKTNTAAKSDPYSHQANSR